MFFCFKQKTAYEMRISDWSSDVCSSDLRAVFCRFSGCNLWSGREADRAKATCRFCDTDFVGTNGTLGGKYPTAARLAADVAEAWGTGDADRYVVLTGGGPVLQCASALNASTAERRVGKEGVSTGKS